MYYGSFHGLTENHFGKFPNNYLIDVRNKLFTYRKGRNSKLILYQVCMVSLTSFVLLEYSDSVGDG